MHSRIIACRASGSSSTGSGFWRRIGYRIIGVVPDAEGRGKPSIRLARRL